MPTNHRRRFVLTSALSFALAGAVLSPALAHAGKGDKGKGKGKAKIERLCQDISCTDAQAKDIASVFKQMHTDIKPDREAIRELREQMGAEWKKAKPDERKLAKLADKVAAHERNIADRRMEGMLELHALLTPEQRELMAGHLMGGPGHRR